MAATSWAEGRYTFTFSCTRCTQRLQAMPNPTCFDPSRVVTRRWKLGRLLHGPMACTGPRLAELQIAGGAAALLSRYYRMPGNR